MLRIVILLGAVLAQPSAGAELWLTFGPPQESAPDVTLPDLVAEAPAAWIYDPLCRNSRANTHAARFAGDPAEGRVLRVAAPSSLATAPGFTIECFVKPESPPRESVGAVGLSLPDGRTLGLGIQWLQNHGVAFYAAFDGSRGQDQAISTGHYVTDSRVSPENLGWRHLALTYDRSSGALTVIQDRWMVTRRVIAAGIDFTGAMVDIGGSPGKRPFAGLIDEVRLSPRVLAAHELLLARHATISGIDLSPEYRWLPLSAGHLDVRAHFGAVGDGKADDTMAFRAAFAALADKVPHGYYTLLVPAGTYRLTDTIGWTRFLVLQGAGRDRTVLRIDDRATGFQDAKAPRPLLRISRIRGAPGSNKQTNGDAIGNYVFDLAIDVGAGNPGAVAVEYHSNNHGAMERVNLRAATDSGAIGLDLRHKMSGPSLIRDVDIHGFAIGIAAAHQDYSHTLERISLADQRTVGIENRSNLLSLRRLRSQNAVPAIHSLGGASMLVLLDATLNGGTAAEAIYAEGSCYLRGIVSDGYAATLRRRQEAHRAYKDRPTWIDHQPVVGLIAELVADKVIAPFGDAPRSLNLPIEELPEVPWPAAGTDWAVLTAYADRVEKGDWTAALQAAIDSGKSDVLIPAGQWPCHGTVVLRNSVRRLFGVRASLMRPKDWQGNGPLLQVDGGADAGACIIERLDLASLVHSGGRTLILAHSTPDHFENRPGAGHLHLLDVEGSHWRFLHPQSVWARQWNPEGHGEGPLITNQGATLWCLGFKTEYESRKIVATAGARTEILGGLVYAVVKGIPRTRPAFTNVDSAMSLIFGMSWYVTGYPLVVEDTRQGRTVRTWEHAAKDAPDDPFLYQVGARFRCDLYTSGAADR